MTLNQQQALWNTSSPRAPLGESGPVYRLTFTRDSGAPAVGDDALIIEIIESFTLLGAVGEH